MAINITCQHIFKRSSWSRLLAARNRLKGSALRMSNYTFKNNKPAENYQMQEEYGSVVNPVDTEYLKQTYFQQKGSQASKEKISLWDHIQSYKNGSYHEKTLLIDPKVAALIAETIEKHSERGPATKFVDADAGLCLVTKEVMERNIFTDDGHFIFEKDPNLQILNNRAEQNYLNKECKIRKVSLARSIADNQASWKDPLYREMSVYPATDWNDTCPNYTLFGTVTHGFTKYLSTKCLFRNEVRYGEFKFGRPEFFLIVSPRTWSHLSLASPGHKTCMNILFGILFDFECVAELPREAFLPWKKSPGKGISAVSKRYRALEGTFFLLRVRPKKDLGLIEGTPPHYLSYFVQALFQRRLATRLIPTVERWLPGAGLDYVRKGYSVYTCIKEINVNEVVPLLNLFVKQKNFNNISNNFVIEANYHAKMQEDDKMETRESKECYANLQRDFKLSKIGPGASGKQPKPKNIFG